MKTIFIGITNIARLLGKQHPKDAEYRLMKYVLQKNCKDGTLLHNVITGKLVLLSKEESVLLSRLPSSYIPEMKSLVEDYYLVPMNYNEKDTVYKLRLLMKQLFAPKGINNYLILTSTNCNARCAYCFEYGIKRINMTASIADHIISFIAAHRSRETVKLHWFGGEPLLCAERIDQICKGLNENKIEFESFMTSNGYLFSDRMIERAVTVWKLKKIQITLDGTEEVYNRVKNYISAVGSPFQRVIKNIGLLLNAGVHVVLRLNLDHNNAENLRYLINDLHVLFHQRDNLTIYVSKVIDDLCKTSIVVKDNDQSLDIQLMYLKKQILKLGLHMPERHLLSLKTNSCMADSEKTLVIHPDGSLSKCESIQDTNTFGHIDFKNVDNTKINTFLETFEFDYCGDCCLYPACILLKACPTKKIENHDMCKKSIENYCEDLLNQYNRRMK